MAVAKSIHTLTLVAKTRLKRVGLGGSTHPCQFIMCTFSPKNSLVSVGIPCVTTYSVYQALRRIGLAHGTKEYKGRTVATVLLNLTRLSV